MKFIFHAIQKESRKISPAFIVKNQLIINRKQYITDAIRHSTAMCSERANQAPYMTKGLRKAIITRSSLKNKLHKHFTANNIKAYK